MPGGNARPWHQRPLKDALKTLLEIDVLWLDVDTIAGKQVLVTTGRDLEGNISYTSVEPVIGT